MTPDYRAPATQAQEQQGPTDGQSNRLISIAHDVLQCAHAWEPEARLIGNVCAEDIADLCNAVLARWGLEKFPPADSPEELDAVAECLNAQGCEWNKDAGGYLLTEYNVALLFRMALARWGGAAPQPVPVTERLPKPEDCDKQGQCWWFNLGWPVTSNPHIATPSWRLCRMLNDKPRGSHWLPASALPLPEVEHG